MKRFQNISMKSIRIIGLSGMLVGNDNNIKPYTVSDELVRLESTFQSQIITVDTIEDHKNVLLCSTNAHEGFVRFNKSATHACIAEVFGLLNNIQKQLLASKLDNYKTINPKSLRETTPRKVKDLVLMFKDFEYLVGEMGPYGGYLSLLSMLIQFELKKRFSDTERYRQLVKACITLTERCINQMEQGLHLSRGDPSVILANSSHKVQQLFQLLRRVFTDPNREKDLQCIIFVKRRSSAKAIYHALKAFASFDTNFPIIPDFMVGINNELPESIESILSSNYNSLTLEKFKRRETNCIVASSVLEEGIDLQMCNLVVMYDQPETYRSYVQARGRARVNNSKYIVLTPNDKINEFQKKVIVWREVDKELKKQLYLKTLDREPPPRESIRKEQEEVWPPFVTPTAGSILTASNCVSLLNHYAMRMPSDRFTNINIFWRRIDHEDGQVTAAVQLPTQSIIKQEIFGDPQCNVKLAKQHAAFKACIMLYNEGELNESLTPVDEKEKVEHVQSDYFPHWKEYETDTNLAGNRVNRRYHRLKTPDVLQDSAPKVGRTNFLYRLMVRPKFESPNFAIEDMKKLMANGKDFGIFTSKRIPKLCKMCLFMTYGEVEVEMSALPIAIVLESDDQLKLLQNFHIAIFRDVLKTWMKSFVLDSTSYLIVPLTEDVSINWPLIEQFQSVEHPRELMYEEINQTEFTHEAYQHRIINPIYRDKDPIYCVINVRTDMSPLSPFPHEDFESYKDYFECKFYGLNISRLDQPMLEVKGISKNMNLFFPGAGSKGNKQRKHERENLTEFLIPSLCHNFKFPAEYWLKALLLPSICHRMQYLLLAEELRNWLIEEGIDGGHGEQIYQLDVDYGNYDDRVQNLEKVERDNETFGKIWNMAELVEKYKEQQSSSVTGEARHTNALLLWDKSKLPIDIDRNWLSVTEVDIDYFCKFLNQNRSVENPASLNRLLEINGSPKRGDRFLTDGTDRSCIKLIHRDGNCLSVQQKELIKVLTTSNAGDVFDMERYEVLGDGFLKFIVSLYLYKEYNDWHEGYLTTLKGKLVSNRNLFYIGDIFGLSGKIKSHCFKATETLPPSIRLPSKMLEILEDDKSLLMKLWGVESFTQEEILSGEIQKVVLESFVKDDDYQNDSSVDTSLLAYIQQHEVGDKIIADAVEAFIGVVVQSLGVAAGLKLCQKLSILPKTKDLSALLTEPIPPRTVNPDAQPNDVRIMNRESLETTIGYKFKNSIYLTQALTHSSYPIKSFGSYEQLEFLGDAVLDFLISCYIIERCPDMDPGKLTDLRSALVNNVTLACIVVRNGIHKHLLSENVMLMEAIRKFVTYQTCKGHQIVLDQIILLETEEEATTAQSIDVPKVIGDILESIIGAVFLDSGMSLDITWKVIYGLLKAEIHEFMVNVPYQIVRQLFEFEKGSADPKFFAAEELNDEIGIPVEFTCRGQRVVCLGVGKNKKLAKKCAAKLALKQLMQR